MSSVGWGTLGGYDSDDDSPHELRRRNVAARAHGGTETYVTKTTDWWGREVYVSGERDGVDSAVGGWFGRTDDVTHTMVTKDFWGREVYVSGPRESVEAEINERERNNFFDELCKVYLLVLGIAAMLNPQ